MVEELPIDGFVHLNRSTYTLVQYVRVVKNKQKKPKKETKTARKPLHLNVAGF